MQKNLILASSSATRQGLLRQVGLDFVAISSDIDESIIKEELVAKNKPTKDIAIALAAAKARTVSQDHPHAYVLGIDQILVLDGIVFSKPDDPKSAVAQLSELSGQTHTLVTASVVMLTGRQIWLNTTTTKMTMRAMSRTFIDAYVTRNWDSIRWSVGGYKIEEEGARLFEKIEGDYFNILGMPLLDIITFLEQAGVIER